MVGRSVEFECRRSGRLGSIISRRRLREESVEKGGSNFDVLAPAAKRLCRPLCGFEGLRRDQLGHLAKVLSGGCEGELVTGTVWTPQAQTVEFENAL